MTDEEWSELEASEEDRVERETQRRVDHVRVRGYALATCRAVEHARSNAEAATDRLERARKDAEHAIEVLRRAVEQAELATCVWTSGDDAWISEVAQRLEECFG